jgi:transcriptional regulator with XRE-family HTH domain
VKHITLAEAMDRADLTQQQLEDVSGVDRTRISKLLNADTANPTIDTYDKLVAALRAKRGLRRGEKLIFGRAQSRVA